MEWATVKNSPAGNQRKMSTTPMIQLMLSQSFLLGGRGPGVPGPGPGEGEPL